MRSGISRLNVRRVLCVLAVAAPTSNPKPLPPKAASFSGPSAAPPSKPNGSAAALSKLASAAAAQPAAGLPASRQLNFSTPVLPMPKTLYAAPPPAPKKVSEADLGDFLSKLRDNEEDVVYGRRIG